MKSIKSITTWEEYKDYVKSTDPGARKDVEEMEELARIVCAIIERRQELGLSQRELAELCGMPQSSVARIETCKTIPNLDTLLTVFNRLGLKITVSCK